MSVALAPSTTVPRLSIRALDKTFGPVQVLHGVELSVRPGEVHALAGGNGAGKSTLMKILQGVYQADSGEILVDGVPARIDSIHSAKTAGIGMVFQEFSLVPSLTVARNILLGAEPLTRLGLINERAVVRQAEEVFAGMGVAHLVRDIPAARVPFLRSGWASLLMVVAALLAAVFQDSLWAVPLHALVFIPIVYGNSLFGLLRLRASRLLGTISYSIYLLHAPLIHAVLRTLAAAGQLDNVSPLQYWLLMGGLVLVIVALCSLTYRFIEHPHLHKRLPARFQWKPRPAAVPAPAPLEHASV